MAFVTSATEAQLFVVGVHVGDENTHHVPQGCLPTSIKSSLLLHDLHNDLSNQLERKHRANYTNCF